MPRGSPRKITPLMCAMSFALTGEERDRLNAICHAQGKSIRVVMRAIALRYIADHYKPAKE